MNIQSIKKIAKELNDYQKFVKKELSDRKIKVTKPEDIKDKVAPAMKEIGKKWKKEKDGK